MNMNAIKVISSNEQNEEMGDWLALVQESGKTPIIIKTIDGWMLSKTRRVVRRRLIIYISIEHPQRNHIVAYLKLHTPSVWPFRNIIMAHFPLGEHIRQIAAEIDAMLNN